ncbi:hypothetical protein ACFWHR_06325 [Leucobacter sp. NPDC058333]|uniref:hypothetical protein n=1 Tax=Leucobacter sp. NPDC058333 TaxID=3346450 RepID=UPI00364FE0F7
MTYPDGYTPERQPDTRAPEARALSPKWMWGVTGGLAVLVLGGAGVVVGLDAQTHNSGSVRNVAERYIDAVQAGDLDEAEQLYEGEGADSSAALTPEVFESATHITDTKLSGFRVNFEDGRASGNLSYRLNGTPYTDQLEMYRSDDDDDDEWQVVRGLRYEVSLDGGGSALSFKGMDAPFPADAGSITAYAGEYELVSQNKFFSAANDARFAVTSEYTSLYTADQVTPNDGYADEVDRQVSLWYEECAAQTDVWELQSCGIDAPDPGSKFADPSQVQVSVEMTRAPSVSDADGMQDWIPLADEGEFVVTYSGEDLRDRRITSKERVQATAGDVEVTPTSDGLDVVVYPY